MKQITPLLHTTFYYFSFVAISSVLLACAQSFPTTHPDTVKNNPATYKVDVKDCADAYPESPDGVYLRKRIACLRLKGWK